MKAPRWWRRWFGGNTVNPTGPASPPPAGVERDLSAFYTQFPTDMEPYKSEPGAIIPPWSPQLLEFPGLAPVPPKPHIELLPGSLPFDPIGEAAAEWNSVPRSPEPFEVHVIPPEFGVTLINRDTLRRAAQKRREQAVQHFALTFPQKVREEADGNYSEMARTLGVAPSVVGRWASGKLLPSMQNFIRFCVAYEYVLGDFTGDDEFL